MATLRDRLKAFSFPDGDFDADVRATYLALRRSIGSIGLSLPLVLVGWGLTHGIQCGDMTALSAFYWLPPPPPPIPDAILRDWFVGSLVAVGMCLIIYRGYSNLENWLLNVAGTALIVVALNPMSWPSRHEDSWNVHAISSITFFLMIALTIWFCADDTLDGLPKDRRARWRAIYRGFSVAMFVLPLAAFVLARRNQRTIWVEVLAVCVFSIYWLVKTSELSRVSKIEPAGEPAPKLRRVEGILRIVRE